MARLFIIVLINSVKFQLTGIKVTNIFIVINKIINLFLYRYNIVKLLLKVKKFLLIKLVVDSNER